MQNLSLDMARALGASKVTTGVVVTDVVPGSVADTIGMKNRDIITHFNKQPIATAAQLAAVVYTTRQGTDAALTIVRQNKVKQITGTLATDQKGMSRWRTMVSGWPLKPMIHRQAIQACRFYTIPNARDGFSCYRGYDIAVGKTRNRAIRPSAYRLPRAHLIELIRGHRLFSW